MKLLLLVALCVVPALSARLPFIIGGNDVSTPGKWPWQASLQRFNSHSCGASLISSYWLVTAAHCVGSSLSTYTIVLGLHDRVGESMGSPMKYSPQSITRNPGYQDSGFYPNDIAIIRISSPALTTSPYISTIQMADSNDDFVGSECWITGWGRNNVNTNSLPNILQETEIDVYTDSQCRRYVSGLGPWHICVGKQYESGACNGDSGGPLVCKKSGVWTLAGAASFVFGNCNVAYPTVYARVSYFRSWIQQNTGV